MPRLPFLLTATLLSSVALSAQDQPPQKVTPPSYAAIPAEAAKQPNPVKSSPESLARRQQMVEAGLRHVPRQRWRWQGQASPLDMKLKIADFTDPATLKDRTDGEIFYIIKTGHQDMPPEGDRIKPQENWDLVADQ